MALTWGQKKTAMGKYGRIKDADKNFSDMKIYCKKCAEPPVNCIRLFKAKTINIYPNYPYEDKL